MVLTLEVAPDHAPCGITLSDRGAPFLVRTRRCAIRAAQCPSHVSATKPFQIRGRSYASAIARWDGVLMSA